MILELAAIPLLALSTAGDLKCGSTVPFPGVPDLTPVVVMDGEVFAGDAETQAAQIAEIPKEDIHSINPTCWDPDTDEMPARRGVAVIVITTDQAVDRAEADLRFLISAVRDFEAAQSRLPQSLADLGITGFAAERFDFAPSDAGLRLSTSGPRDYHCAVDGDVLAELEMRCESSVGLAKVKLREAYDRGAWVP